MLRNTIDADDPADNKTLETMAKKWFGGHIAANHVGARRAVYELTMISKNISFFCTFVVRCPIIAITEAIYTGMCGCVRLH